VFLVKTSSSHCETINRSLIVKNIKATNQLQEQQGLILLMAVAFADKYSANFSR
jgi:hypothetical protein